MRRVVVTGVGLVFGLAAALSLSKAMTSMLFQVSPFDPAVLAAAIAFMAVVGALAAYLPARRATTSDPAMTLRG